MIGAQVKLLSSRTVHARGQQRQGADGDQQPVADPVLDAAVHAEGVDLPPVHNAAHEHGADDARQEKKIVGAFQLEGFLGPLGRAVLGALLAVVVGIQDEIGRQQQSRHQQHVGQDLQRPEKRDPVQESQKQRRVAEGRQAAADVGHQEDEEHHHEGAVFAIAVGSQKGPDEQHGRPGGAHPGGDHGADHQHQGVDGRGSRREPRSRMPPETV